MKVLFINPAAKKSIEYLTTPLGLLSIASYLEKYGHTVKIFESALNKGNLAKVLKDYSPDIVGVSVISGKAFDDAVKLSKIAKSAGKTVVWGGFLPTVMPELSLKTGTVDIISIGEGEYTWLDLLQAIESGDSLYQVKGLAYFEDNHLIRTPERDLADLATLPTLNFELLDVDKYFYSYYASKKTLALYASKGCPGHCTFCYNSNFNKSKRRRRPAEQVVEEIIYLSNKYGLECVHFNDDLMFADKEEMYSLCSVMRATKLKFYWGCSSIIGVMGREELQYMYDSGCRWIFYGIESGSKNILNKIKKGYRYDGIEQNIADCAEIGITTRAGFILGFPDESEADLMDTISLAMRLKTRQITFTYYSITLGSEAYEQLLNQGKFKQPESLHGFTEKYLFNGLTENFSNIPDKDLKVVNSYFFLRRLFAKDPVADQKTNSWRAVTYGFIIKSLLEFNIEKFIRSTGQFLNVLYFVFCHPKIRRKYGLKLI